MKTVLITGISKGLGSYLCQYLSQDFRILGLGLTPESELLPELSACIAAYCQEDLQDFTAEPHKVREFLAAHEIDVLINNAAFRQFGTLPDLSDKHIARAVAVNYLAPVLLSRAALPSMIRRGFGRIINIGSQSGLQGYSSGSVYCSSKSALMTFTEALSKDLAQQRGNVTANVICPDAFRSIQGDETEGGAGIVKKVGTVAGQIINSKLNGEMIPVMRNQTRIIHAVKGVHSHLRRLIKT